MWKFPRQSSLVGPLGYRGGVSEVQIVTPRGIRLSGTFVVPVDSTDAAVIFSHSVFDDRMSGLHFKRLASIYRSMGYATVKFDYSGHGLSDDDVVTFSNQAEDLRAVSGWLADQGFRRQLIHGHSFGTLAPMKAAPSPVKTMILSAPITGPLDYDWEDVFSVSQLDELEMKGFTTISDDSPGPRAEFLVSRDSLAQLSLNDPKKLLGHLEVPVLLIHDADDIRRGLTELTMEASSLLPEGSHVETVEDASFGQGNNLEKLSDLSGSWARAHVPVRP